MNHIELLESRIAPATITVTTLADTSGGPALSLRDAILQANTNDNIAFAANLHGTIHLTSELPLIEKSIGINGDAGHVIGIDAGNKFQIFSFGDGINAMTGGVSYMNLMHGQAQDGGAATISTPGGTITFAHCGFKANHAAGGAATGGAILITKGTLVLNEDSLTGNSATGTGDGPNGNSGLGGALYASASTMVSLEGCTVKNNSATGVLGQNLGGIAEGGGIFMDGSLTMFGSTVSGNRVTGGAGGLAGGHATGGGLYIGTAGSADLQHDTISGNHATGGNGLAGARGTNGGIAQTGTAGADGGGGSYAAGGGIFNSGVLALATCTISGNAIHGGTGRHGGAGGHGGAGDSSHLPGAGGPGGNAGSGGASFGAGVANYLSVSCDLQSATISGNTATVGKGSQPGLGGAGGAGISNHKAVHGAKGSTGHAAIALTSCGGGLDSYASFLSLEQVTIAHNKAGKGGGVYMSNSNTSKIDNCTIAFNKATVVGGGLWVDTGTGKVVTIESTVIAGNTASPQQARDAFGDITENFSFIGDFAGNLIGSQTSNLTGPNPLLGALGHHGGETQTILPSVHSILVNAGSNPDNQSNDQRGQTRSTGSAPDIGAVEVA